jgi:hypothetical protein
MKKCKKCNEVKSLNEFVRHKECVDGYSNTCKKCKLLWQQIKRTENDNTHTKKYEKTINGFLMRAYRNMKSRVTGIQSKKFHLYAGKNIISKQEFYDWSLQNAEFNILYNNWIKSNYNRKLSPSVDRIDSSLGYELENMRWITHSENSKNGSISRHKNKYAE